MGAVVVASWCWVRVFLKHGGPSSLTAITNGPRTSAVARDAGFQVVAEAEAAGVEQLAAAVTRAIPNVTTPGAERPRRLRTSPAVRALVQETRLDPGQLIAPHFVISGRETRTEIPSLVGHHRL